MRLGDCCCRRNCWAFRVDLSEKLGQSQYFVSKYERGERRLDVIQLRTVCLTLAVSLPEFVDRLEKVLRSRK